MKKSSFLGLLLTLSMLLTGLVSPAVFAEADEINWDADEIVLDSAADYQAFHAQLVAKNSFEGQTVRLGASLNLEGFPLEPISNDTGFWGVFDGQNHTLSNLTLTAGVPAYSGALFGAVGEGKKTVIKNLGIVDSAFSIYACGGTLYGNVHGEASFENVYLYVDLTNLASSGQIGGFVGRTYYDTVELSFMNCLFDGSIGNTSTAYNYSPFIGIIENMKSASFENCLINGRFTRNKGYSGEWLGAGKFICTNNSTTATVTYTDCIQYNDYYQNQAAGQAAAVCPQWTAIGEGLTAKTPVGFTVRETGYPVPTALIPIIDGTPAQPETPPVVEPDEPDEPDAPNEWSAAEIVIETADKFVEFQAQIMAGNHFVGQTVKLGADIDLAEKVLAANGGEDGFWGTFDGQGHVISNLKYAYNYSYLGALFGSVAQDLETKAVIKNFALKNAVISANKRTSVLYASVWSDLEVENVYVQATLSGKGDYCGGFVGHVGYGTVSFKACAFEGSITNTEGSGAFIGKVTGNSLPERITLTDCLNLSTALSVGKNEHADAGFRVVEEKCIHYSESSRPIVGQGAAAQTYLTQNGMTNWSVREIGSPIPTVLADYFDPATDVVIFTDLNGNVLQTLTIPESGLTMESFPEVESTMTLIWIDQNTGALITAPHTFTAGTTVTAKEYGKNESRVIGLQIGETVNGKNHFRFIGGIWSMDGAGAGLEVVISYRDGEGKLQKKLFRGSSSVVYDSVNATENGTLKNVTAKELGVSYLFAFAVENIPVELGQLDITVRSFKEVGSKRIRIYSEEQTYRVLNGAVDLSLSPLT